MMQYSVQPTDGKFLKGYGYLSFAENMDRNIGKTISGTYLPQMHLKLLPKEQFKNCRSNW